MSASAQELSQPKSLGDVAREKKNASGAHSKRVLTNEDFASGSTSTSAAATGSDLKPVTLPKPQADPSGKMSLTADQLADAKAAVHRLKSGIAELERRLTVLKKREEERGNSLNPQINCSAQKQLYGVSACEIVARDNAAKQQIESNLGQWKTELARVQEELRQMGYGSAVYDTN